MGVCGCGQTVMVKLSRLKCSRTEVHSLHHAACCHNSQHTVKEWVVVAGGVVEAIGEGLVGRDIQFDILPKENMQD